MAWYRQVKDAAAATRGHGAAFPRHAPAVRAVPPPSVREVEPAGLLRFSAFFSQVGHKGTEPQGTLDASSTSAASPRRVNKKTQAAGEARRARHRPARDSRRTKIRALALADWMSSTDNPFFAKRSGEPLLEALLQPRPRRARGRHARNEPAVESRAARRAGQAFRRERLRPEGAHPRHHAIAHLPAQRGAERVQQARPAELLPLLRPAAQRRSAVRCGQSRHAHAEQLRRLPPGTRAIALPDNSFNASSYFLTVFGRPESSSACECERTQEASLAQACTC